MPEAIKNIIEILEKIWQGINSAGFPQTVWEWLKSSFGEPSLVLETVQRWFNSLNDWLTNNAGVSLKEVLEAIANLFIWLFKLILKIIQYIVDLLEKLNG